MADDEADDETDDEEGWNFPFEKHLHAVAPAVHEAQNAWLASIDSIRALDRKTHELIRMVCTVVLRNPEGIQRHAMLAAEVGATWEEIASAILLTEPGFGLLPAVAAMPAARRGFKAAKELAETE
jgi:alkylhydroperoxidase/carboxymuconolactone decarboxylase family protein YurZ